MVSSGSRVKRLRFTLRSLLLLVMVAAVACGYGAHLWRQKERERRAESFLSSRSVGMSRTTSWQPPRWLGQWIGSDLFTRVESVQIWHFQDEWMPYVADLRHVRGVHIKGGALTDAGIAHLSSLSKISDLYVDAPLGDELLENLRQCQLQRLVLRNTDIRGDGLVHLDRSRLKILALDRSPIADEGLRQVGQMKQLRALFINAIEAGEEGLSQLRQLDQLETLCLINLPLADEAFAHLPPNVQTLYLRGLPISDGALEHLVQYEQLRQVQFIYTDVSPEGANWMQTQRPDLRVRLHPSQGRKNSVDSFSYDIPFLVHPGAWLRLDGR
jgi:hypothetical protein